MMMMVVGTASPRIARIQIDCNAISGPKIFYVTSETVFLLAITWILTHILLCIQRVRFWIVLVCIFLDKNVCYTRTFYNDRIVGNFIDILQDIEDGLKWGIEKKNFVFDNPMIRIWIVDTFIKYIHSNLNIANKSIRPFLFTISNNLLYQK